MSSIHLRPRGILALTGALMLIGGLTVGISNSRIESTRRELVVGRLRTAVDIVRDRAETALTNPSMLPAILTELHSWGSVTGMRLTLIRPDGSVLADTEVEHMPNIADRPEVRAARQGHSQVEFRRSVMTGKESLYVAIPIERDGKHVGTLRAATNASEVDEALAGFENMFALIAACCLVGGASIGLVGGWAIRERTRPDAHARQESDRKAA